MHRKVVNTSVVLVVCVILIACGPSEAERNAQVTAVAASVYATETAGAPTPTATPAPPPTATLPPAAAATEPPPAAAPESTQQEGISLEQAMEQANKAFSSGLVVYLYDPQPNSVSRSNLDATEFSLRYILSKDAKYMMWKDAKEVTNIVFLRKVNAEGAGEYIIPAIPATKRTGLGDQTVYLSDWASQTGTLTFTPSSNTMIATSDQQDSDPNVAVLTAWIVTWGRGITPLYGPPNQLVEDPVYLDVLLLAPEERAAAQLSPDAPKQPWATVMLLSKKTKLLSNTVRIPIAP